jgi:hypothetical protein
MKPPRPPLFVEQQSYRLRRLRDAARLLPALALILFLMPMLWAPPAGGRHDTASDGVYLFLAWAAIVIAARLLAPRLGAGDPAPPPEG